jgi:hypothetical protein
MLRTLVADLTAGNGEAVAAHFLLGPELRWEVYDHLDPPSGTKGALRTRQALASFAEEVGSSRAVWVFRGVVPPTGDAGLPETAVFGLELVINSGGRQHATGAKVVIDCKEGLINHMVGPTAPVR